jgi:hypothetical protein
VGPRRRRSAGQWLGGRRGHEATPGVTARGSGAPVVSGPTTVEGKARHAQKIGGEDRRGPGRRQHSSKRRRPAVMRLLAAVVVVGRSARRRPSQVADDYGDGEETTKGRWPTTMG